MERMRHREWERAAGRRWLAVAVAAAAAFAAITLDVFAGGPLSDADGPVATWMDGHRVSWVTGVMKVITALGSWPAMAILALVAGGLLFWRYGDWRPAAVLAVTLAGAIALYLALKAVAERPRPPVSLSASGALADTSFPSGHATQTAAVLVILALILISNRAPPATTVIGWMAGIGIVLVAASRVYLGVHWVADVLAGVALGVAWAASMMVVAGRGSFTPRAARVRIGRYRPAPGP